MKTMSKLEALAKKRAKEMDARNDKTPSKDPNISKWNRELAGERFREKCLAETERMRGERA